MQCLHSPLPRCMQLPRFFLFCLFSFSWILFACFQSNGCQASSTCTTIALEVGSSMFTNSGADTTSCFATCASSHLLQGIQRCRDCLWMSFHRMYWRSLLLPKYLPITLGGYMRNFEEGAGSDLDLVIIFFFWGSEGILWDTTVSWINELHRLRQP